MKIINVVKSYFPNYKVFQEDDGVKIITSDEKYGACIAYAATSKILHDTCKRFVKEFKELGY